MLSVIVPLAVAAAVSPLLIVSVLYYLGGTHPIARALAFVIGVTTPCVVIALLVVPGVIIIGGTHGGHGHTPVLAYIYLFVGIALLFMALVSAVRNVQPSTPDSGASTDTRREIRRAYQFGVGLELLNFSSLPLYLDGLNAIRVSGVASSAKAVATALFIVIMLCEIYIPVIVCAIVPELSRRVIAPVRAWLTDHLRVVTFLVGLIYGVYFVVKASLVLL